MSARKYTRLKRSKKLQVHTQLRWFYLLPVLEALAAIALIFSSPSQDGVARLLGLSMTRWVLVLGLAGLGAMFAAMFWLNKRGNARWAKIEARILDKLQNRTLYAALIVASFLLALISFYLCMLAFKFTDALVQARLMRLLPLVLWLLALGAQTLVFVPQLRETKKPYSKENSLILKPAAIALATLFLIALLIYATRLGLQPDRTGWDTPGVPLMATQILIAWLGALLLYGLLKLIEQFAGWRLSQLDIFACVSIWLLAVVLWQAQPLTPTYFSPPPRAPNFEFYPYSDAASHDLVAQNLLIGQGFTPVSEKPLYSFFLAMAHAFVGQDYLRIVFAQTLVLGLFPVLLYLLATRMQHRFSGFVLALAVILRERNAIALSGDISVSHSKLLMTDLPTALGLVFLCLLLFKWMESDQKIFRWLLVVGATIGFLILLRSQILILLPFLLVLATLLRGKKLKLRLIYASVLLLGFMLAALPWLVRNYAVNGQFGYSQPLQALYLSKQYSLTPEANDAGFPEGTPTSEYASLGFASVFEFTRQHPDEVAQFISAHFFHNEVSSFLALPIRFDLSDKLVTYYNLLPYWHDAEDRLWRVCCSLDTHIASTPYWSGWDGVVPRDAWLPIAVNLALVALGISAAWQRKGWVALIPLGIHLLYNFSTAVARVSGWRLVLPVDWVLLLYYCLGIGQLSLWSWRYFFGATPSAKNSPKKKFPQLSWRQEKLPQLGLVVLLGALLLPATELLVLPRYMELDAATAVNEWRQSDLADETPLDPNSFLQQSSAQALWGRALYPRYYPAGEGEPGGQWPAFNPLPFARLGFVLIGPQGEHVVLPLEIAPEHFPNDADVLVFGCGQETYLRAVGVIFLNGEAPDLLTDLSTFSCDSWP